MTQEMAEEDHDFFALEVVLIQVAVQRTVEAFRTDGDAREGGDAIVTIPMMKNRGLSYRAPGLAN